MAELFSTVATLFLIPTRYAQGLHPRMKFFGALSTLVIVHLFDYSNPSGCVAASYYSFDSHYCGG